MWNVVIAEVSNEQHVIPMSTIERLDACNKDVGDIGLIIVVVMRRHMGNTTKRSSKA
jgi:hypothetical protein